MLGALQSVFREPDFLPKGGEALSALMGPRAGGGTLKYAELLAETRTKERSSLARPLTRRKAAGGREQRYEW